MTANDIVKALNGRWGIGGAMCKCPAHKDRTPSLSIAERDGKILLHCFAGCSRAAVVGELQRLNLWPRDDAQPEPTEAEKEKLRERQRECDRARERNAEFNDRAWRRIWAECVDAQGTSVERYLAGRHSQLPHHYRDVIRFHRACPFKGERVPVQVALLRDIETDEPCGIHRTALLPDGSDRDRKRGKAMLGRSRSAAIKLCSDDQVTHGLGLVEGIETGLAVIGAGWRPIWAAGSAGGIANFPVLNGIEALTVFADADEAGMKAARACADRWAAAGREAIVRIPHRGDWNDALVAA